jgi:hypothetical protein
VKPTEKSRDEVVVRRLKEDLRQISGGFPERHVVQEDIEGLPSGTPELRLAALLSEYSDLGAARLESAPKRAQSTSKLLLTNLQQRLFSSIRAFGRTLEVHRKTVLTAFRRGISADDAPPPTETVAAKLFRDELALLDEMAAIAP